MFKILKTSFIIWLVHSSCTLVFKFPFYKEFNILLLLVLASIFLTGIGHLSIQKAKGKIQLKVFTLFKQRKLSGKINAESWWSYEFTNGAAFSMGNSQGSSKPGANNIISYLQLTDEHQNKVVLREVIYLDTRFPNEAKYSDVPLDKKLPIFDIQRTDKMHQRLKSILNI